MQKDGQLPGDCDHRSTFGDLAATASDRLSEAPQVRVAMNVKLVKLPRRSIVASKTFENVMAADENSMKSIMGAFDTALGKTLKGVVSWTLREGQAADKRR